MGLFTQNTEIENLKNEIKQTKADSQEAMNKLTENEKLISELQSKLAKVNAELKEAKDKEASLNYSNESPLDCLFKRI